MSHGAKLHQNPRFSVVNCFPDLENVSVKENSQTYSFNEYKIIFQEHWIENISESIEKQLGDAWDIYLENQSEQSLAINWKQQGIDLKDDLKSTIGNLPGFTSYLPWTNQDLSSKLIQDRF